MSSLAAGNVRLTKGLRERIRNEILKYKYIESSGALKELINEHMSVASMAYNTLGEDTIQKINDLPNGWLPDSTSIRMYIGGDFVNLYFNGNLYHHLGYSTWNKLNGNSLINSSITKRLPSHMSGVFGQVGAKSDLADRYQSFTQKVRKFKAEFDSNFNMVNSTLNASTTTNKLIAAWPESKPFVQKMIGTVPATSTALTVPISVLNEKLGLPVPA